MRKSNSVIVVYLIAITMAFLFALNAHSQNVIKNGKTFIEQVDTTKRREVKEPKKTQYIFIDKNGNQYDVYLSSNGKAFIIRTSKRTNKPYRQYLPKVTEQLKQE